MKNLFFPLLKKCVQRFPDNLTDITTRNHNDLANRNASNSHPAEAVAPDTTNFNRVLSATEDDLQKVADKLDDVVLSTGAGEINAITEKTTPVGNDVYVIEDSESVTPAYQKKRVKGSNIYKQFGTAPDNTKVLRGDGTWVKPVKHVTFTIQAGVSWDNLAIPVFEAPKGTAITIVQVNGTIIGGTSLVYNIEERAYGSANSAGTDIMADSTAVQAGTEVTSFTNPSIATKAHLFFTTGASAQTGTVNYITVTVYYTEDVYGG